MRIRIAWAAAAFCLLLTSTPAAASDGVANLYVGSATDLPADPIESSAIIRLSVEVRLDGQGAIEPDPQVEISLRREDKAEACITEVAVVPAPLLLEDRSHTLAFAIDTQGLSGGRYEVVVTIKWDGVEASKIDNRRSLGFVTISDPRPELHPVELSTEPALPLQWGETGVLHTVVANTGRLAAGAFHVMFDIRPRAIVVDGLGPAEGDSAAADDSACDWIQVASRLVPGLARNAELRVSAPLDIASLLEAFPLGEEGSIACGLPNGASLRDQEVTFDVRARVVYPAPGTDQAVAELDPGNNEITGSWQVIPSTLGRPDLVPLYITFDEDLPLKWDDPMTATATVANIGGRATAGGFSVRFSYRALGDATWLPLGADDDGDGVADGRRVKNALPIEVGVNETRIGVGIDPRGVSPSGRPLEPGSYELRVEVDTERTDGRSEIAERNETNNTLIVGFSVRGTELQAQGIELPSSSIRKGDTLIVKSWIVNTGDRPAKDFAVGFYLNDERFDTFVYTNSQGLQEDERTQAQGVLDTRDLPPASYDLRVIVDPDDRIPEYDEGNNTATMPILILSPTQRLAELHTTSILLDPPSPIPLGTIVTCRLTLRNVGEIRAESFDLVLEYSRWLDGQAVWTPYTPLLDPNGAPVRVLVRELEQGEATTIQTVFSTAALAETQYRLRVVVDPDEDVSESNETNNAAIVSFAIGEPVALPRPPVSGRGPNLAWQALSIDPLVPCERGAVTVRATLANTGDVSAPSFTVAFRWTDPYGNQYDLGSEAVDGLGSGLSRSFSRTLDITSLPRGAHQVVATADTYDRVDETDETDNTARAAVTICGGTPAVYPDLVPISIRFDSPGAAMGEDNTVEQNQVLYAYVTVRNIGNIPSGPFNVTFDTPLGTDAESWTSIGALDQVEVSHPLPTGSSGEFALAIRVDPDNSVAEENETNNTLTARYAVVPSVVRVDRVLPAAGSGVRWIACDPATGVVYAVSTDGRIRSADPSGTTRDVASIDGTVQDVMWSFGTALYAYVGTATEDGGAFRQVDLKTGTIVGAATFGSPVVAVARGGSGQAFVAVGGGFHELTLDGAEYSVSRQVEVDGVVRDILYDADRATIYVLTTDGVHAYGGDLAHLCSLEARELVGTPAVLALAGSGLYIGTSAGTGGVLYAASHCTVTAASGGHILVGWRFPRTGTLPGTIESILIDPRDIDPIYVTTDAGTLYSLGFDGNPQWEYAAGAAIRSLPFADKRSGRIFFGDDTGVPHILTIDGDRAVDVDSTAIGSGAIRSTLLIVETRERTEFGLRLVRSYYYGTEDGAVYRIAAQQ